MHELAARCGIYCGDCDYKEKMNCTGCQQLDGKVFWGECEVAKCVISKGYNYCYECDEFPCETLNQFAYDEEQGDNGLRIENLRQWRDIGIEKWLKK